MYTCTKVVCTMYSWCKCDVGMFTRRTCVVCTIYAFRTNDVRMLYVDVHVLYLLRTCVVRMSLVRMMYLCCTFCTRVVRITYVRCTRVVRTMCTCCIHVVSTMYACCISCTCVVRVLNIRTYNVRPMYI